MTKAVFQQVDKTRYNIIMSRYQQYLDVLDDITKEPVRVFDPLSKKQVDELLLIRQVSEELQKKKEDDLKKAAQAAEEAAQFKEAEEKEIDEEKKESQETTKTE